MADTDPPELAAALLKWAKAFPTSRPVENWADLQDGRVLWDILKDIDPTYFEGDLPESLQRTDDHWIPRWQNLKHINRLVTAYLRDSSDSLENPSVNLAPDLKAIATDGSARDTVMLLKSMLRAAMYSPESNQRMGRLVVSLGPEAAMTIAGAMKQMEEEDAEAEESEMGTPLRMTGDGSDYENTPDLGTPSLLPSALSTPPTAARPPVDRDPELEQEEKLIQAFKTIKQLQVSHEKAATELEELRQDKEELQRNFDAFRYEVENEGRNAAQNDIVKELQRKADRDRDYIAELETELETTRTTMTNQERQIERYKADTDAKQKLRDDLQEMRAERDDLLQKSRANENLKKKIQTLQDQAKANATLEDDLRLANEQLQDLDKLRDHCTILQKANAENLKTIANGEQEIFDQKTSKKRLEHEYKVLAQKWEVAKERQGRDHETITELENRLQTLEISRNSINGNQNGLADELAETERTPIERSDLQSNLGLSADAALLQQKLDAITARNTKLEAEYLDILQDKLGLETAVQDLREPSREPEENVPFLEQRKKLQVTQAEVAELKAQLFTLNSELASIKEKLIHAESDMDGRTLDSNSEYQALTERYAELRTHSGDIEAELAEQRALLRHALLSTSALSRDPADIRNSNEYKLIVEQLESIRKSPEGSVVLQNTATCLADRIESARADSAAANKRAEDQAKELATIKKTMPTQQAPSKDYTILQRENKLMASAWFDLSSRLQSNTVMVGRRKESPKSFLGKQRAEVAPLLMAGGQHRR
ncbi:hypothetical protein AAFC00_005145 [Neodothiora populina]|uniref:HOOK N-terminal domain-containing protein n=1 Tax=Neodothiora populina TaxID=2781224 RepID=A0ABR3PJY9_9PEZI